MRQNKKRILRTMTWVKKSNSGKQIINSPISIKTQLTLGIQMQAKPSLCTTMETINIFQFQIWKKTRISLIC